MEFSRSKNFFVVFLTMVILVAGVYFAYHDINPENVLAPSSGQESQSNVLPVNDISNDDALALDKDTPSPLPPPKKLTNPPKIIKAVYATGYSAGTKSYINYLANIFATTEINAVVIDIKGSDGVISYPKLILDIDSLVRFLHSQNIYVIGRIAVFEDPLYSKARPEIAIYDKAKTAASPDQEQRILWRDNNNLAWLDPAATDAWDYNISIAKDALQNHGFDEINFDYIRFPSDGNMENLGYPVWDQEIPKHEIIKEFFRYTRSQLEGEKISADLFGQTTVNTDDMGIGQIIEDALEYFDYISPMVYPSHYVDGFIGFQNPADHPYEIVKYSMDAAKTRKAAYFEQLENAYLQNVEAEGSPAKTLQQSINYSPEIKLAKFRPWLQDFNMGADYNAFMVEQEIKAVKDSLLEEFEGYMLWNPRNIYTVPEKIK